MRIEEVRLRNFRSYGNDTTTLDFAPGLNVILGRIGSGKSSVLEAILVCLFGFSKSGIRKNDILRKDATAESLQLELTFHFDDMHFKISRGNENRLESSPDAMSWTLISESSTEIDAFVENTLEVSARKFRDLFYAAQGELTDVITGSPEDRQKSIDKLVGAEGLRETYERLSEFSKFFEKDIGTAEGKLSDIDAYLKRHDLDALRDGKRKAENEIIGIENSITRLSDEITRLSGKLEEAQSRAKPLEEANWRYETLREEIRKKDSELEKSRFLIGECRSKLARLSDEERSNREKITELGPRMERAAAALKEMDARLESLSEIRAKASNLAEQERRCARTVENLRQDLQRERAGESETRDLQEKVKGRVSALRRETEEANREASEKGKNLEAESSRLPALEEALRKAGIELNGIRQKAEENAEKIARLNSLSTGAQCPFCEQAITAAHKARVVRSIEDATRKLLAKEKAAGASAEGAREELEALKEELESGRKALADMQERMAELKAEHAREDQNLKNLSRNLEESQSRIGKLEESLAAEERQLESARAQLEEARKASGMETEDWVSGLERAFEEAREGRRLAQEEVSGLESERRTAENMANRAVEDSRRERERMARATEEAERLQAEIARGKEGIRALLEPLIGEVDDPGAALAKMIKEVQSEIQEQKELKGEKQVQKASLSGDYRQKEEQVSQLARDIEEYLGEEKRRKEVKRTHTIYSEAKNLLLQMRDRYKDAREMVRTNLINVLKETLRVEFENLYTYDDFHEVIISDSYDVSLKGPVGEIQAHNLSAGQKAITAIAFRLAVAKAMQMKIGCWIIDEPTQNIGKTEVDALADVLADTSEIPQIVIATHHESLGRNGHVISLGLRGGETILGEGMEPVAGGPLPQPHGAK